MNDLIETRNTALSTLPERFKALRERAEVERVEIWQPLPGETLAGEYLGHQQVEHPRYGSQWQILLKDETGTTYATWLNAWLRQNLKAQSLALGDLVAITYYGKKITRTGTEYNSYGLLVDKTKQP